MTIRFRSILPGLFALAFILFAATGPATAASPADKNYKVSGIVHGDDGKPLSYATVGLYTTDSTGTLKPVAAVVTDDRGRYTLPAKTDGAFTVQINYAGYAPAVKDITFDADHTALDLGTTAMAPQAVDADAVVVKAQMPLVSADIDKISYNLDADPETDALTGLEMMRKVPMVTVDGEDNIKLKGQGNFKFLVNGKPSSMISSNNYKDVLRAIPASQIKRIEVITNPPAKYDAEGIGGLINIVMERKPSNSYSGSMAFKYAVSPEGGYNINPSAYAFAGKGKFNFGASFWDQYGRNSGGSQDMTMTSFNNPTYYRTQMDLTYGANNPRQNNLGGTLDISYEIDTANLISFTSSYNGWNLLNDQRLDITSNTYDMNGLLTQSYTNNGANNWKGQYTGLTLDYQHSFRNPDETLIFSYGFIFGNNKNGNEVDVNGILNFPSYRNRSDNNSISREHTFQLDYYNPITKKHTIETGAKYIMRPNGSGADRELWNGTDWVPDPAIQNGINYTQNIGSLYAGYRFNLKKFGLKAGVRGEYTLNNGTFHQGGTDTDMNNEYFNLVPYLTLNYKPSDSQNLSLGYSERLSRPSIWNLNPYVQDVDPKYIWQGNPDLKAEVGHKIDLSYGVYKQKFNVNVSASAIFVNNGIQSLSRPTADGGMYGTYANTGKSNTYGLYFYGSLNPWNNKLTFSLNAGVGYGFFDGQDLQGNYIKRDGITNHNVWLNINSTPWKNGNLFASGGYYKSELQGIESAGSSMYYSYSIGVSQKFLNRKLQLTFNAQNPFLGRMSMKDVSESPTYRQISEGSWVAENYSVTLRWNFGNTNRQVKKAKRTISNDDLKSGGGGGLGSGGSGGGQ